jgi:hypothetical protein
MKSNASRKKILFPVLAVLLLNISIWPSEVSRASASTSTTTISSSFELKKPFLTEKRSYISLDNATTFNANTSSSNSSNTNNSTDASHTNNISSSGSIEPLITSGDKLSNGYTFANIPDGLGAVQIENGTVDLFVNDELENDTDHGGFAKVSRLRLNQTDGSIIGAELVINGSEGYQRFCSASLVEGYGFEHPIFFTNEEVDDGVVLAIDAVNGTTTEMPWLGKFSHENTIHVPLFSNTINKTVVLSFEDGKPTESEAYMFVADTPRDLLAGKGQLYVFGASSHDNNSTTTGATATSVENKSSYNSWDDIYLANGTVNGNFIPLIWDYKTQNELNLIIKL